MLGSPKPRRLDEPIAVSLDDLVPRRHFYRHLEAKLDLSFVREWVQELYAGRGRPSIDPVVFFKLQLIMFFEGIRSERKLIETASLNLAHRWYLGYTLDEDLPDHSSLTRIRQRLGVEIFQRFFERIVDLCQETGLVWGRELYVDATKVEANADLDSLVPRFFHEAKNHVADLFADDAPTTTAVAEPKATAAASPAGVLRLPRDPVPGGSSIPAPPWRLLEERRRDPHRPTVGTYRGMTAGRVSRTDPDTTPMRTGAATMLGYHDHYVVDGGKARIILAALVTPADVMENVPLRDLLWRVCFRRKLWPQPVTGDTTYGTVENIVAVEDAGIRAFFPLPDFDRRTPFFGKGEFTDDAEADACRCPQDSPCPAERPSRPRKRWSTGPTPRPATRAWSRPPAPPAITAGSCTGPSMRNTSTRCRNRVGATSRSQWQPRGAPERAMVTHNRLQVTAYLAGDDDYRIGPTSGPCRRRWSPAAFFNRQRRYGNRVRGESTGALVSPHALARIQTVVRRCDPGLAVSS